MKYDYRKAECWYIKTQSSTLRKCSDKYKIPFANLAKYARENEWKQKKKEFKEKSMSAAMDVLAEESGKKLATLIDTADQTLSILNTAVKNPEQFFLSDDDIEKKLDTKAYRELVSSLKDLVGVIRNLNSIPTDSELFARKMAERRLELEEKRIEKGDIVDRNIVIEFLSDDEYDT